jgi:hypothetical protein
VNLSASGAWRPTDAAPSDTSNLSVPGTGRSGTAGSGSVGDTSNRSAGVGGNQPGGAEKLAAAGPQTYNVFWWSSRTIRKASARRAVLKGTTTQEAADKTVSATIDSYQILVNGSNMAIFQQRGEQAFKETAFIQLHKTKQKLSPTDVTFQKGPNGEVMNAVFSFAKKGANGEPTISSEEKEIDFNVQIGGSWLRTFFSPKQMVDSEGGDL